MNQSTLESEFLAKKNRDHSLDVAKGLMMLSVVAGHIANFPFGEVFYYYHVAGFFLLSGYFFNYDKYSEGFVTFLKSRAKLIYQYLAYSAIIIMAHNVLIDYGAQPINYSYYSFYDCINSFIRSITIPSEALAGAMWFIPVLIIMQIIFYWLNRAFSNKNSMILGASVIILFFIGWWMVKINLIANNSYLNSHIPNAQYFVYLPFFYVGFIMKGFGFKLLSRINILMPTLITVVFSYLVIRPTLYLYGSVDPYDFIFMSLVSISFVIGISHHIKVNILVKLFRVIGENTVHILAMHFLLFKLATLFLVTIGVQQLDALHSIDGPSNGTFIENLTYLSFGVGIPLIIISMIRKIRGKVVG